MLSSLTSTSARQCVIGGVDCTAHICIDLKKIIKCRHLSNPSAPTDSINIEGGDVGFPIVNIRTNQCDLMPVQDVLI
jgi:hypothetical protein